MTLEDRTAGRYLAGPSLPRRAARAADRPSPLQQAQGSDTRKPPICRQVFVSTDCEKVQPPPKAPWHQSPFCPSTSTFRGQRYRGTIETVTAGCRSARASSRPNPPGEFPATSMEVDHVPSRLAMLSGGLTRPD